MKENGHAYEPAIDPALILGGSNASLNDAERDDVGTAYIHALVSTANADTDADSDDNCDETSVIEQSLFDEISKDQHPLPNLAYLTADAFVSAFSAIDSGSLLET